MINITTTKQSTTKPWVYFMGYTVSSLHVTLCETLLSHGGFLNGPLLTPLNLLKSFAQNEIRHPTATPLTRPAQGDHQLMVPALLSLQESINTDQDWTWKHLNILIFLFQHLQGVKYSVRVWGNFLLIKTSWKLLTHQSISASLRSQIFSKTLWILFTHLYFSASLRN